MFRGRDSVDGPGNVSISETTQVCGTYHDNEFLFFWEAWWRSCKGAVALMCQMTAGRCGGRFQVGGHERVRIFARTALFRSLNKDISLDCLVHESQFRVVYIRLL